MPEPPRRDRPRRHVTLPDFCRQAKRLLEADDTPGFVHFVLNGLYDGHQYVVDAIRDRLDDTHDISALRDYDSVLAVNRDILFHADLTLFPHAAPYDTLRKDVHIKVSFTHNRVPNTVPLHKIPNVCIGKWNIHNMVRVVIPGKYSKTRLGVQLSENELTEFYNKGFYPAIRELVGGDEWPATYSAELFREYNTSNVPIRRSMILSKDHVPHLAESIRRHLRDNQVDYADGILIYHQIQGVKATSTHRVDRQSAEVALADFLDSNGFRLEDTYRGSWWIDVGLEITSAAGECLIWRTDSHSFLLENALDVPEVDAIRCTTMGSSEYQRDMASHIPTLSGCRIKLGSSSQGPMRARYFQLYMTDKSVTARNNGHYHGNYITGSDILKGKFRSYLNSLYNTYCDAAVQNSSHARMEARLPIAHATRLFMDINLPDLRGTLVSYPKNVWWGLRAYRCLAFAFILQLQAAGPAQLRLQRSAFLLTSAAPWFLNGLHCTPDDGPSSRDLVTAVLPHANRDEVDPNTVPFVPRTSRDAYAQPEDEISSDLPSGDEPGLGLIRPVRTQTANTVPFIGNGILFFEEIRIGEDYPVPRFNGKLGRFIKSSTFKYIFGVEAEEATFQVLTTDITAPAPKRISNKTRSTPAYVNRGQDAEETLFLLARRGYSLAASPIAQGSDDEENGDIDGSTPVVFPPLLPIDEEITRLWRQALQDFLTRSPNKKKSGEESYCRLDSEELLRVNEETYRNRNLAAAWVDCQFKVASQKDWDDTFDRLFPDRIVFQAGGKKSQNYLNTKYYPRWAIILDRVEERCRKAIRKALRERFNTLYWIPHARAERIWWTKGNNAYTKLSGREKGTAAPQILVREGMPTWEVIDSD